MVKIRLPHALPARLAALWITGLSLVVLIGYLFIATEIDRQQQAFDEAADSLAL